MRARSYMFSPGSAAAAAASTVHHRLGEEADVPENHSSPFAITRIRTRTSVAAVAAVAACNIHRVHT